jgi:hypothetical protein
VLFCFKENNFALLDISGNVRGPGYGKTHSCQPLVKICELEVKLHK